MIKFDNTALHVEYHWLKSATTARGGYISIVDDEKSTDDREVYKTIKVPFAVARKFVKRHGGRNLHPVLVALTFYNTTVVSIERHALGAIAELEYEGVSGWTKWRSNSEEHVDAIVKMTNSDDWFIDGTTVYQLDTSGSNHVLSSDFRFETVGARCIKLRTIGDNVTTIGFSDNMCVKMTTSRGDQFISPPIWKDVRGIGTSVTSEDTQFTFDAIDERMMVNLQFVIKAGNDISAMYGYSAVEPLRLDELMVRLGTVNLPNIPQTIKKTYDSGLQFTHMVAWLMGLMAKARTLGEYSNLRALMKFLTSKGIYNKQSLINTFKKDKSINDVPLMTIEQAANVDLSKFDWFMFSNIVKSTNMLNTE